MTYHVYRIDFLPTGQIYFGSTNDPDYRWMTHKQEMRNGNTDPVYVAMRLHGLENTTFTVVSAHPTRNSATTVEVDYIRAGKHLGNLLNRSDGGVWDRPGHEGGSNVRNRTYSVGPKMTREEARRDYWRRVREGKVEPPLDWIDGRIQWPVK
jgi:predicted GIY-YIG superfamily endonuclease